MIILNSTNRFAFRQLLALNFTLAILLSAGTSWADDTEKKVEASSKDLYKQIEAAVRAGRITKVEAQAKLKAWKKHRDSKHKAKESDEKKTTARLESIWTELQSLVAANKMSQDEANRAMSTIKKAVLAGNDEKKTLDAQPSKDRYKRIEAAVLAGKITKEEAQAKLNRLQQQDSPRKAVKPSDTKAPAKAQRGEAATQAYLEKAWAKLQGAVTAGTLTREQAIAKMAAIKKAKLREE